MATQRSLRYKCTIRHNATRRGFAFVISTRVKGEFLAAPQIHYSAGIRGAEGGGVIRKVWFALEEGDVTSSPSGCRETKGKRNVRPVGVLCPVCVT